MNRHENRKPGKQESRKYRRAGLISCFPVLLFSCFFCTAHAQQSPTRPNFIVLLVDDWGWRDAGVQVSDLDETPNIDRFATTAVRFTDGYAACTVCSPTRNALMTGMYPARTNCTDWIAGFKPKNPKLRIPDWNMKLDHEHVTIAEALKRDGYATAHVGKWHLTPPERDKVDAYLPTEHGFDVNIGGNRWGAPGSYFYPFKRGRGNNARAVTPLPEGGKKGDYLTDFLTDHALKFIENQAKANKPFYLNFWYYNVHTPIQGRPDLVEKYKKKLADMPHADRVQHHKNATYAAMVESVDISVGRILAKLDELGVADNTVIILTGDNGGLDRRNNQPTDNHPLREGKGHVYEGGTRVPLMIRWPNAAKPAVTDTPAMTIDFYPTMLQIAGVRGDPGHNANVDGTSLVPVLLKPETQPNRDLFWHYPHYHAGGATPYGAIRRGDYKLIEFYEGMSVELYNLKDDLGEKIDLAEQMPDKIKELRDRLHAWRTRVDAQMPTENVALVR